MATFALTDALPPRIPGRLCLNPTSFGIGSSYPYGGTSLGAVTGCSFSWGTQYVDVVAEEWGEVVEVEKKREFPVFSVILEQFDADLLAAAFSVTLGPSPSGLSGMKRINGASGPGVVAAMNPLLFAPYDPEHPGLLIHRPIPLVNLSRAFNLALGDPAVFGFIFKPTRTSAGMSYQVDRLEHLALT